MGAHVAHSNSNGAWHSPEIRQQCRSDVKVGAWHSYLLEGHSVIDAQTTALVTVAGV